MKLEDLKKHIADQQDNRVKALEQEVKVAKLEAKNLSHLVTEGRKETEKLANENRALRNERKSLDEEINGLREARQQYDRRERASIDETTNLRKKVELLLNENLKLRDYASHVHDQCGRLNEKNVVLVAAINSASKSLEPCLSLP